MSIFKFDSNVVEVHEANAMSDDVIDWGLKAINAEAAWAVTKGKGVKVAILDTGCDFKHKDLQANVREVQDFTGSRHGANDVQGHGSHVSGIVAGIDNQIGMIGVAPEAELYIAKVLGDNGSGSIDSIIRGIRWAMAHNVDVINMSLGTGSLPPVQLHDTIKAAVAQGIVVLAATGNENGEVCWPARYDEAIAVSAVDSKLQRAVFSNFGITNEICAPGVDILSTYHSGKYAKLSGTSMATPIVAGAAALFIAAKKAEGIKPSLAEVHAALMRATIDLGNVGKDEQFGVGMINLAKLFA